MNVSLLLRIICLVAVVISGGLYFQIRDQKLRIEDNLTQSRIALQDKLEETASLKSWVLNAEESSKQMSQLADEEMAKSRGFKEQFDDLSKKANEAIEAQDRSEKEVKKLSAANRDLQRQIIKLDAAVPPQNWREQQNKLQSRLLQLEAENFSLKKSLSAVGLSSSTSKDSFQKTPNRPVNSKIPVGSVIRIGPNGAFVIISYGRQKGAVEGQALRILRDQQTVGLVSLTQITNDFSIAQILSSTNTGSNLSVPDIQIGDSAHLE